MARTLGKTRVEYHLLYFCSFQSRALVLQGELIHHVDYFSFSTYPMDTLGQHCSFSFQHSIKFIQIIVFRIGKGSLARDLKIFRVYFFISGISLLPTGMDNTMMELRRNTRNTPPPASLDSNSMELHVSPLYKGSLSLMLPLLVFKENCAQELGGCSFTKAYEGL